MFGATNTTTVTARKIYCANINYRGTVKFN